MKCGWQRYFFKTNLTEATVTNVIGIVTNYASKDTNPNSSEKLVNQRYRSFGV